MLKPEPPRKTACCFVVIAVLLAGVMPTGQAQDEANKPTEEPGQKAAQRGPAAPKAPDAVKEKKAEQKKAEQPKKKQKPQEPPEKPANKKPVANPIQKLFQRILGPQKAAPAPANPKPPQPVGKPPVATVAETNQAESDPIDRRLVMERSVEVAWKRARRAIEEDEWSRAVPMLDQILQQPSDCVMKDEDGTFKSMRLLVQDQLRKAPAEVRQDFIRQYGAVAQQDLDRAIENNDERLLVNVATRYLLTEAGIKAADLIATRLLDRGEFAQAAVWLEQAIRNTSSVTESLAWRRKAALVFRLAGRQELIDLLPGIDAGDNAELVEDLTPDQSQRIREWMMLFGRADRYGVAEGSRPVLMKRWSRPSVWNRQLVEKIDEIIRTATDNRKATVPAGMPLLVNGRVVYRTMRGVHVANAETGEPIWSTGGDASLESQLLGQPVTTTYSPFQGRIIFGTSYGSSASLLEQLLFQNSAFGLLSTDGKYVYVVEDRPMFPLVSTSYSPFNRNRNALRNGALVGNRLRAYDLETGRLRWQAGGPDTIEEFAPALRGCFFLGAPVPEGDELYVLAEREGEVSLHALDRESGHPGWSQPLAAVENPIDRDILRRIRSSQLAVSGATVVCPTSSGWLVGVDRTRRVILWTCRYQPPQQQKRTTRRFSRMLPRSEPLGTRWVTSAPIITGDRVIFTPPDTYLTTMRGPRGLAVADNSGTILCVHLRTGKKLWQKPRATYVYLAGLHEDLAVLVGLQSVKAVSIIDGKDVWTRTLGSGVATADGQPSGRGVIIDGILYQPLQRNRVVAVELKKGEIVSRVDLPADERPLGNLLTYRGQLISQHASSLTAWELSDHLQEQLAAIRTNENRDESATLFKAKAAMAEKEYDEVLKLLEPIRSLENNNRAVERQREIDSLMRDAMVAKVERQGADSLPLLDRLDELVRGPADISVNLQMRYRSLRLAGKHAQAFDVLLAMIDQAQTTMLNRVDDKRIRVSLNSWLTGELRDAWQTVPDSNRPSVTSRIAELLTAASNDSQRLQRLVRLFAFHQATESHRLKIVQTAIEQGQLAEAASWLRESKWQASRVAAVQHMIELIDHLQAAGDSATARWLVEHLDRNHADVVTESGKPVREVIRKPRLQLSLIPLNPVLDWGQFDLKITRSAMSYMNQTPKAQRKIEHHTSILDQFDVEWGSQTPGVSSNRLSLLNSDGSVYWSVPLRQRSRGRQLRKAIPVGPLVITYDRDVLSCLSIPERRVVWSVSIMEPENVSTVINPNRNPMVQGSPWLSQLNRKLNANVSVPVANSNYLCVRERRKLTVIDTLSGDVRFTCRDIQKSTRVYGTRATLFIIPPESNRAQALRSSDGQVVKRENFVKFYDAGLRAEEDTVVTAWRTNDGGKQQVAVAAVNPDTGEKAWEHHFPLTAWFRGTSLDELAVLTNDGLTLLDVVTGHVNRCESLPEINARINERYVTADRNLVYLVVNTRNMSMTIYSNQPAVRANGHIVAFNRRTGKRVWHKPVANQRLMLSGMQDMPVLLFSNRGRSKVISTEMVDLLALDKRTGRKVLEYSGLGTANLQSIKLDRKKRSITLRSYRDRLHLTAVKAEEKADPAAGE